MSDAIFRLVVLIENISQRSPIRELFFVPVSQTTKLNLAQVGSQRFHAYESRNSIRDG